MEESKSPAPVAVMHSLPTVDSIDTTDAIDLVVDGLPAGDVGLLVGPSGAGKTWLVLDIAASVSAGVDVAGDLFVVPRDGLVLGFFLEETKGQIAERLQAIQRGRKLVARHLMGVLGREDFTGPGGRGMSPREKLEKICDAVDYAVAPRLVIIDNAKELLVGSENEGEVVAVLMNVLREVAQRHQCAVLLAHHASEGAIKGGPRKLLDVTAARGHSSWASYSRWSCNMARVPSQGAMRALVKISRVTHDALMPAPRLLIMAQDGDNPLGFQTAPASRNVADRAQEIDRDDLVKAIAALPVPLSKRSTANAIKGSLGVGRDVVVRAIGQAVSAGDLVEQAARGGRGKVVLRA